MKKLLIILIILFTANSEIYSQTGFRIRLLSNLNPYPLPGLAYSALWGYTGSNGRELKPANMKTYFSGFIEDTPESTLQT